MQKLADLSPRVTRCVQKVQRGRGMALCAAASGRCARSSCPPPGACRSRWVDQVVDAVCSICRQPSQTLKLWARCERTIACSTVVGNEAVNPVKEAIIAQGCDTTLSCGTSFVARGDGARLPGHGTQTMAVARQRLVDSGILSVGLCWNTFVIVI